MIFNKAFLALYSIRAYYTSPHTPCAMCVFSCTGILAYKLEVTIRKRKKQIEKVKLFVIKLEIQQIILIYFSIIIKYKAQS